MAFQVRRLLLLAPIALGLTGCEEDALWVVEPRRNPTANRLGDTPSDEPILELGQCPLMGQIRSFGVAMRGGQPRPYGTPGS
jgi:hypothetical protein